MAWPTEMSTPPQTHTHNLCHHTPPLSPVLASDFFFFLGLQLPFALCLNNPFMRREVVLPALLMFLLVNLHRPLVSFVELTGQAFQ